MTYKEKTEEFIKDLNIMLTDTLMFPDRVKFKDAYFAVTLTPGMVDEEDATNVRFCYFEDGHIHLIFTKTFRNSGIEHLWHITYINVLRYTLFTRDTSRELSFYTIFESGLDKLKTNKQ